MNYNPKTVHLLDSIDIELSGYCNSNCVFCPRDRMTREIAVLGRDAFDRLLREVSDIRPRGPRVIYLTGHGEPLHNRNIFSYADTIRKKFFDTFIAVTSNGTMLTEEVCNVLLASKINSFQCSMQSIHRNEYEAVMGNTCFESVMRWMAYLAGNKSRPDLDISVSIVRTQQTDQELEEYRQFWKKMGVTVSESMVHNRGGFLADSEIPETTTNRIGCGLFNSRLFVAGNADVLACCHDLDGQSRLGTIGVDSLASILALKLRMTAEKRLFPMCAQCNDSCGQY